MQHIASVQPVGEQVPVWSRVFSVVIPSYVASQSNGFQTPTASVSAHVGLGGGVVQHSSYEHERVQLGSHTMSSGRAASEYCTSMLYESQGNGCSPLSWSRSAHVSRGGGIGGGGGGGSSGAGSGCFSTNTMNSTNIVMTFAAASPTSVQKSWDAMYVSPTYGITIGRARARRRHAPRGHCPTPEPSHTSAIKIDWA